MIGDGDKYRRGHVAVVDVVVNGEEDLVGFRAECGGNLKALLQHAHVFCAVRNIADIPSCRIQSAVAVADLCHRHEQELGQDRNRKHENNTAKTESHRSMQNNCEVRPLSRAVRLYSEEKFVQGGQQHNESLGVLHFVQECSEAGLFRTQTDELRICKCQGKAQSDACQCSQDHVQPIPYVSIPMEDKLQKAWPHAMMVWGKGVDHLDKIVSTMKAFNDFSILLIETMDYTDNISNIMRPLFAADTRRRSLETLILPSPPSICALILFLDHKPVLTLYGEQGALNNETFANKRVIDLQQQILATVLRGSPGHKDHIIRLSSLPSEFNTIVKSIPGGRPIHVSDYDASHAAFYSPYFLRSNLGANIPYEVDIVGIKKLRLPRHENVTRGSFLFGKTAAVYEFPHFATFGAACPNFYNSDDAQHSSMSFENTSFSEDCTGSYFRGLVDTFDLSQYPQCVNTLGGASRRSYVIVDREYRVLDGAHKVALAATCGATRMEVIVLQRAAVSKAAARAVPCAGALGGVDLDSPTPALRVSLGLRVLAHCGIPYVIMNVFNPLTFPAAQKLGERVDVLTGTTTLETADCLRSVFPAGRVRAISLSHMHVDLLDGQEARLFVRFNLYSELPYIFHGVHLNWKADILAHSQTRLSPLGFEWPSPSAIDSAAMHYLEWVDWHKLKPDCIKHLQWVANHPNIMFPLPDASFRPSGTKKRYRTMLGEGTPVQMTKPSCPLLPAQTQEQALQILVFSKNRPWQLLLLLQSMEKYVVDWDRVKITAIVSASDTKRVQGYILVQRKYQCVRFLWDETEKEKGLLRAHVLAVLSIAKVELTLTLRDDYIFVRYVAASDIVYAFRFEGLHSLAVQSYQEPILQQMYSQLPNREEYHFDEGRVDQVLAVWSICRDGRQPDVLPRVSAYGPTPGNIVLFVYRTELLKQILQARAFDSLDEMEALFDAAPRFFKVDREFLIGSLGSRSMVGVMPVIKYVAPTDLLLTYRFDVIVKAVYAIEFLRRGHVSTLIRDIYQKHLKVLNNFSELCTSQSQAEWFDSTKLCMKKSKPEEFEHSFQDIVRSLERKGFNSSEFTVPVSKAHYPLDGAVHVAAAIALNIETVPVRMMMSDRWFRWDEAFFVENGFDQEYARIVRSRFQKHVDMNTATALPQKVAPDSSLSPHEQHKFLFDLAVGKHTVLGMTSSPSQVSTLHAQTKPDPDSVFKQLCNFLGVCTDTKRVAHALAIRYNGSLQKCIRDMCGQWPRERPISSCIREIADALVGYSPFFACVRHGVPSLVANDVRQGVGDKREEIKNAGHKICSSAERTVIRHFKKFGLWGWAVSQYEQHADSNIFGQLIALLVSPDAPKKLAEELGSLLHDNMKSEAIHILRVRVSQLLYYVYAEREQHRQVPASYLKTICNFITWLASLEYAYTGPMFASALRCVSDIIRIGRLSSNRQEFFYEALKRCESLKEKTEISIFSNGSRHATIGNNFLLQGARAIFSAQTVLPHGRTISSHIERTLVADRLLIGVMSKPDHIMRRAGIRKTWSRHCKSDDNPCEVVFVLGTVADPSLQHLVEEECRTHGDILWIRGIPEGIRSNFSRKVGSFFSYGLHMQSPHAPSLVLRTDDDVFVNVRRVMEVGKMLSKPLYWGFENTFESTLREGKYKVNYDEFAAAFFPPFISGASTVLSRDLIEILLVNRPLLLSTKSLDDVDIGYQLIDIVDRVYDNSRFVWRMQGGCQRVIASQGEQDFLICESVLTGQGDNALLEHDRTELFALGY